MSDSKANKQPTSLSRRSFLKNSACFSFAIGTSGLITSMSLTESAQASASGAPLEANIWVTIHPDNSIVVKYGATEFGQGSMTHIPMMLAEHLDADWDKVEVEIVKVHDTNYGNPVFLNWLYTAGSTGIAVYGKKMTIAGTQARKMLLSAVAEDWGVAPESLSTEPSVVVHAASGRRISYGDIVATMALPSEAPEVDNAEFKPEAEYRYIGQSVMRRDVPAKSNGSEIYAIDMEIPGMAVAAIKRTPVEGDRPLKIDTSKASKVKGIIDFVTLPDGVAIVGETVEATQKAKSMLRVVWSEESPFRQVSSDETLATYTKNAEDLSISGTPWIMGKGDPKKTLDEAPKVVDALYTTDAAYHGQMEPLNAIASVSADGKSAEIWVGTQSQSTTIVGAAELLETSQDKIKLHPITMGGGFGRRAQIRQQYIDDALLTSKAMKRPIKVVWSREDDIQVGTFRAATAQYLRGCFDTEGKLQAIHHRVAGPEIIPSMNLHRWEAVKPKDVIAMMGSENSTYDIPHHLPEHIKQQRGSRVNAWRGISTSYTKFGIESFLDELAYERGIDPLEFRLQLTHKNPRAKLLFETIAEMCEWNRPREKGVGLGIAFSGYHKSLSVGVAELSVDNDSGRINLHKYWGLGDAGRIVSPRNSQAQLVGNIIWGLSSALKERITIENGIVQQTNFHDYNIMRINELPDIECRMIETDNPSTGVGELGLAMTAPSIANAVFNVTGKRIRHMPLTPSVVSAALKA